MIQKQECKFETIEGGTALRSKTLDGFFFRPPTVDESFIIFSDPIDPTYEGRMISTSLVTEIISQDETTIVFRTLNSTYKVELK